MAYEILLSGCATLDMMIDTNRECQVSCTGCEVYRPVDLSALRDEVGGDYSLVNRRCRCRLTPGCTGWNRFFVKHGGFVRLWDQATAIRWTFADKRAA